MTSPDSLNTRPGYLCLRKRYIVRTLSKQLPRAVFQIRLGLVRLTTQLPYYSELA